MARQRHAAARSFAVTCATLALFSCSFFVVTNGRVVSAHMRSAATTALRQAAVTSNSIFVSQIDGEADSATSSFFRLTPPLTINDIEFVQTSSNTDVLVIENNDNILVSTSENGQLVNLTVSNSFDGLVGDTTHSIIARRKDTGEEVHSSSEHYVVCGMSFYRQIDGEKKVVSGLEPKYAISYQDAIASAYEPNNEIRVFVQYPDGQTSEGIPTGPLPKQSGLSISQNTFRSQYQHNAVTCDMGQIGSYTTAEGLKLPAGCGYGLYRNEAGELCFGILYTPYRAGAMAFDIAWDSLVADEATLADEGYAEKLGVTVTGLPPIVVTDVEPKNFLFRPEGGQAVTVTFFNGDLRSSNERKMVVENATSSYFELPGSYSDAAAPTYTQTATYITETGEGSNLPFTFQYAAANSDATETSFQIAKIAESVDFSVSYDPNPVTLSTVSPLHGLQTGGETITVVGYFKGFDENADGVYFNGARLPSSYYTKVTDEEIQFTLPPRSELGEGFDFLVDVRIGNAISESVEFYYTITEASVIIEQSGTTQLLGDDVYRLGDCVAGRMTAVVSPFTNQVQRYEWTLKAHGNDSNELVELLGTSQNPLTNSSAQTIEIEPSLLTVGETYKLEVRAVMPGTTAITSIDIVRENAVTIGAFIMEPVVRSVASPETPFRLSAIVRTPNSTCYSGTRGLVFEWTGFGKTQRYSPEDATGEPLTSAEIVTTTSRLGWEFLVPQNSLTTGQHEVTFKTWMEANPLIAGSATRTVTIQHSPLQAVIRGGESQLILNKNTDVDMTGSSSVDPDKAFSGQPSGLSYEWSCLETTGNKDFSDEGAVAACDAGFLPGGAQAETFTVRKELFSALSEDVKAIRYLLKVQSADRVSESTHLTIEFATTATTQPHLTGYEIQVQDADKNLQNVKDVKYYKPIVIDVKAPDDDVSWTYEMVEPERQTVLKSTNLIQTPVYYSPDFVGSGGNKKPLGIQASKLSPGTTYTLKVSFAGSASFEDTDAFVTFKTSAEPALNFPEPSVMQGTTLTQYTATAGIPQNDFEYTYYFLLEDSTGASYCVGGCTGSFITYFRIGRPGSYKLSVLLYDSQGKAFLRRQEQANPIIVTEPESEHDLYSELGVLFANGDDSSWTQLAYDLASELLSGQESSSESSPTTEQGSADSSIDAVVRQTNDTGLVEKALSIGDGLRKIVCASRPSSGHGTLVIDVATKLSALPFVDRKAFYDITGAVSCVVQNTPKGTALAFKLEELMRHLEDRVTRSGAESSGSGRRRLLQTEDTTTPSNFRADLNCWSGKMMTATTTSSEATGFSTTIMDGRYGLAMVANQVQLPVEEVNEIRVNGLRAGNDTDRYIFFPKGECTTEIFAASGDQKRYIMVQAMSNFITEDGFQSKPPPGGYLSDSLYRAQVFKEDEFGQMQEIEIEGRQDIDPCFCHRLPIKRGLDELNEELGSSPGMFSVANKKPYGVDATRAGQYFSYVVDESQSVSYNIKEDGSESWVEVCSRGVGFAGPTIASRAEQLATANDKSLAGKSAAVVTSIFLGGMLVVCVAVITSWVIATKTMAAGEPAPAVLEAHELYVERDIYGRGTIFGPGKGSAAKAAAATAAEPS